MDLSFIVIGKNEEKNINRCLESIHSAAQLSNISNYEIIYSDSDSTDKSRDIAKMYNAKVHHIRGVSNAARGRNEGAKLATGKVLFFIDADMEVNAEFLKTEWKNNTITEDILSGQRIDITDQKKTKARLSNVFPGGTFLIKREAWIAVGGMRTRFKTGEESDLGFRLMRKGFRFVRRDMVIVNHYTIPYLHKDRLWKRVTNKSIFYNRAVIYRHHFFDRKMWQLMWRIDKTFILFVLASLCTFIYFPIGAALIFGYLSLVWFRARQNSTSVLFYVASDALNLYYFFTFYPKDIGYDSKN